MGLANLFGSAVERNDSMPAHPLKISMFDASRNMFRGSQFRGRGNNFECPLHTTSKLSFEFYARNLFCAHVTPIIGLFGITSIAKNE